MKSFLVLTILLTSLAISRAGLLNQLESFATTNQTALSTTSVAGLSQDQMIDGLK
jgi:hypothetical protein